MATFKLFSEHLSQYIILIAHKISILLKLLNGEVFSAELHIKKMLGLFIEFI